MSSSESCGWSAALMEKERVFDIARSDHHGVRARRGGAVIRIVQDIARERFAVDHSWNADGDDGRAERRRIQFAPRVEHT